MATSITFHPTPDSPAHPIYITLARSPWPALRECLAADLGCHEDDLDLEEVLWSGPNWEEETAEVVTLDCAIIGSIERALTAEDIAAINGEAANGRRAA